MVGHYDIVHIITVLDSVQSEECIWFYCNEVFLNGIKNNRGNNSKKPHSYF